MFYSITGQVVYTEATSVAVSCGGVYRGELLAVLGRYI